jgi:hypothetical protein
MNPIPSDIGEYLSYDPETGKVVWTKTNSKKPLVGKEAGYLDQRTGYLVIRFNKKLYQGHRVIWYLYYGKDPGNLCIDHINRDRTDNRITNLRLATRQQNLQNTTKLGIYFDKSRQQWRSEINLFGEKHYIGQHTCPLMVGIDYLAAKSILHPMSNGLPQSD